MTVRLLRVALGVGAALFLCVWLATPLPHGLRATAIEALWLLTAVLGAAACLVARREVENARLRASLSLLALGAFAWAGGQAVATYGGLVPEPAPAALQVGNVAPSLAVALLAAAVALWPREAVPWGVGRALDVALVAGFAGYLGIKVVLEPTRAADAEEIGAIAAFVHPPSATLLLGVVMAALVLDGWRDRARLELVSFALLALFVADASALQLGEGSTAGGLLAPLWILAFAGIGWAMLTPAGWRGRRGWIGDRARALAPSAALLLLTLIGVGIGVAGREPLERVDRLAVLGLVLLLAARQGYTQLALLDQMAKQRRLQERLRESQKLEAVGRLAGGVAHDFNNLLTAIDGYSDLALSQLSTSHAARGEIEEVRRAAQRAAGLTRQLLAFSRRQVLAPRVVDLDVVIGDSAQMLRRLAGENVELRFVLGASPTLTRADPGQLEQVITNLVVNARDAMPDGGVVTIETFAGEEHVSLVVADAGAGMTGETMGRMFEPFFTTKEVGKGTGLGLAVVHGIVAQSGGEISVASRPGGGSRFEVRLPAASAEPAAPTQEAAPPQTGSEKVLLVEDEPAVRELARRMLELEGYSVVVASSGEEAERVFGEVGPIDVLLTDLVMPGIGGRELADRLRRGRPGLRVVLMSGYSQDVSALDELRAAGAAFVEKPFTSSGLVSQVRRVLDAA